MTSPRARIELLVRGADGTDFETRRVESSVAYLQLRPQRISAEQWELAEAPRGMHVGPTYVLKNRLTEEYLLLTEAERFLWERMDGHTSLQEMATAYVLHFGSFDLDLIPALIAKPSASGASSPWSANTPVRRKSPSSGFHLDAGW